MQTFFLLESYVGYVGKNESRGGFVGGMHYNKSESDNIFWVTKHETWQNMTRYVKRIKGLKSIN